MNDEITEEQVNTTEMDKLVKKQFLHTFSYITIGLLVVFAGLNMLTKFYAAVAIDGLGIVLYLLGLWFYLKTKKMNLAGLFYIFTSCLELFLQSIILEPDAIHNLFFFVPVGVFCFALFNSRRLNILTTLFTASVATASFLVPRYFATTLWVLSPEDKNLYMVMSLLAAFFATYKIGATVYYQKQFAFDELSKANKKLEMLNQKTKSLLQLIIHDVSNPLTSIDLAIKMAAKESLPENKDAMFRRLDPAMLTIREIIESAREMIALEDGKISAQVSPSNLEEIIGDSVSLLENTASKKNITITTELQLSKGAKALVEPRSFKFSVLSNLLTNAIKFSHRNSEVKIQVCEENENIAIRIIDKGIGIEKEMISSLFDPTVKTSRPGTEGEPGTGFGLPLAKAFVSSYGGNIEIESEKNTGSIIKVTVKKALKDMLCDSSIISSEPADSLD